MPYNLNTNYYQPSKGSLTGFDQVNIPPSGSHTFPELGWSLEELRAYLLNQDESTFPSKDWLIQIEQAIEQHLTNTNNPHHLMLSDIVSNFVEQIVASITPGSIPKIPPFYSYQADLELPLNDIFPATFTTTNLYRLASSGEFKNPTSDLEIVGSDYTQKRAGIPLFTTLNNIVPVSWNSNVGTPVNTSIGVSANQTDTYNNGELYDVRELQELGEFGIVIPMNQTPSTVYTTTFFITPNINGGVVKLFQPSTPNVYALVSLTNGEIIATSPDLVVDSVLFTSGTVKISLNYKSHSVVDNGIKILFYDNNEIMGERIGILNRLLFSIAQPITSVGPLNQPIPIDPTLPYSSSSFQIDTDRVSSNPTISHLLLSLELDLYPVHVDGVLQGSTILSFGTLTITRDKINIFVNISGVPVITAPIRSGLNKIAISYSPTKLIYKDAVSQRRVVDMALTPLSMSSISIGPCSGYLVSHVMYGSDDRDKDVEYLSYV